MSVISDVTNRLNLGFLPCTSEGLGVKVKVVDEVNLILPHLFNHSYITLELRWYLPVGNFGNFIITCD